MITIPELPSSIQCEKAVVCAMLGSAVLYARGRADGIDAASFHHPAPRIIFEAMGEMERDDKGGIDVICLYHHLNESGLLERAGGPSIISDIAGYVYTADGWARWTETLREMKTRRMAFAASQRLAEAPDAEEAINECQNSLAALRKAFEGKKRSVDAKAATGEFIAGFEADHAAGDIPGKSTGIDCIDAISGGMRPGEFWVVAGKPSRGKSVLLIQLAESFLSRGEAVSMFSLEMNLREIIGRLVCVTGRVHHSRVTLPKSAGSHDLRMIQTACTKIKDWPLWIDASAGITTDSILAEAERIRDSAGKLALVVVDYLQLIRGHRAKNESREEEIARASGSLKQLAKHLQCPVITASQLNEQNQTRESRAIEQDADALLYIAEDGIKVGKLRNAQRDQLLPLLLDAPFQRFRQSNQ